MQSIFIFLFACMIINSPQPPRRTVLETLASYGSSAMCLPFECLYFIGMDNKNRYTYRTGSSRHLAMWLGIYTFMGRRIGQARRAMNAAASPSLLRRKDGLAQKTLLISPFTLRADIPLVLQPQRLLHLLPAQ
jgi:hypothetical protein